MKTLLTFLALTLAMFYGMLLGSNLTRPEKQTFPVWAEKVCFSGQASWGQVLKQTCKKI